MTDFVFNIAKGKVAHYASLPAANDALIAVSIETTGLEDDATLIDYNDLAAILAASNNEQTNMGRKTLASVASTVNDTNDRAEVDADDVTWLAPTGNPISKVIICYDPDTTAGTDADLIPLCALDLVFTPGSGDLLMQFAPTGFIHAS